MIYRYRPNAAAYYRSDKTTPVTKKTMQKVRNQLADGLADDLDRLARRYARGDITLGTWANRFAQLIRQGTTAGYLLGAGGRDAVTADALMRIDALIAKQIPFAEGFLRDLATSGLSDAEITARAQLYAGTAVQAYEQAKAVSNGIDLPVYPGDGGTDCLGRCRCSWTIETTDTEVSAWWDTHGDDRVCDGCLARANQYNPLVMQR